MSPDVLLPHRAPHTGQQSSHGTARVLGLLGMMMQRVVTSPSVGKDLGALPLQGGMSMGNGYGGAGKMCLPWM